jgi:hypothetical protein
LSRSIHAKQVLENPVWEETFAELKDSLVGQWESTSKDDWRLRERIFSELQALKDVKQKLETYVAMGQFDRKP